MSTRKRSPHKPPAEPPPAADDVPAVATPADASTGLPGASPAPRTRADAALLDATWVPIDWTGFRAPEGRVRATHRTSIENEGRVWTAYMLSDGRRVIGRYDEFLLPGDPGTELA